MKTNTFVKLTFAVLAFLVAVLPVKAQLNAENAFRTIPSSVIPYYDENMRLDLIDFMGRNKMNIGIVEENTVLRKWYEDNGFVHTGTRKFDFFPFTCGYMEKKI